jgi:hypothetical protein
MRAGIGDWLYLVFLARSAIDHFDLDARGANAIAQFRGQVPLDLLRRKLTDPWQQRLDEQLGFPHRKQRAPRSDFVSLLALGHAHLVGALVAAGRGEKKFLAYRPETQQADAEFSLNAFAATLGFHPALDGIADVGGNVLEVWLTLVVAGDALTVVRDAQK